jgi:hypothetical protein
MLGDDDQEDRISNFSSRSSIGIEEPDECVQKWEKPIDLSFFDCYFQELRVEQVTNLPSTHAFIQFNCCLLISHLH